MAKTFFNESDGCQLVRMCFSDGIVTRYDIMSNSAHVGSVRFFHETRSWGLALQPNIHITLGFAGCIWERLLNDQRGG